MDSRPAETEVLIVGAGPTGLVLALWLTLQGVRVRIIDKAARSGTTSRALAVHARTLELYEQAGLADEVVRRGHLTPAVNLWVRGRKRARIGFDNVGAGMTAYPFMLIFPQDEHERLLEDRLAAEGVKVERSCELAGFAEEGAAVTATLRGPEGEETCRAAYLAGCDGAHSAVREGLKTGFAGSTYNHLFYVADVAAGGPPIDGELHVDLDEADLLAVFPLAGEGRARLIGTVREDEAGPSAKLGFEDVNRRAMQAVKIEVGQVNWFSTYRVHHRVSDRFRVGRAFLLGDAAHIHSPVGGQGMNTGIGDAINLAWKLTAVLRGEASQSLLDTYEPERIAFARRLVASTDRGFTVVSADGPLAAFVRTRVVPVVIPALASFRRVRRYLFRTVSQITINYRMSALSVGRAGAVRGGDRLPWIAGEVGQRPMAWVGRLWGDASPGLVAYLGERGIALDARSFGKAERKAGLAKGALYLCRPDDYVGLADPRPTPAAVFRYLDARGLRPGAKP